MTFKTVRAIFGWTAVVNIALLVLWVLFFALARDWLYHFHGRWFSSLTQASFDAVHYASIAAYELAIWVFLLGPWLAFVIVGALGRARRP